MHPNVAASVAANQIEAKIHRHAALPLPVRTPADFATQIGYELHRITKTLLVKAGDTFALIVAPMGSKVDFATVASHLQVKRVEVAPADELERVTQYPPNGVSPLGVAGVRVLIDEMLFQHPTILIGAGEAGVELEIHPEALARATDAVRLALIR